MPARHLLQNYSLQWVIAIFGFLHNQVGFFTEPPTWFLFKTDSIGLQNRLNSLNRTDSTIVQNWLGFFTEPTRLFYLVFLQNRLDYFTRTDLVFLQNQLDYFTRTDSVFLQNRLGFFTEPTRFFELVFSLLTRCAPTAGYSFLQKDT